MARSNAEHCSGVPSLNGDSYLLKKMVERQGVTRTGPEVMTKLLEKGKGFGTKHTSGLSANMMGTKWCVVSRSAYLVFFCCSACSATKPGSLEAKAIWDGTRVSGHVASHCIQ